MTFGQARVFKVQGGDAGTLDRLNARWQDGLKGRLDVPTSPTFEEAKDRMIKKEEVVRG